MRKITLLPALAAAGLLTLAACGQSESIEGRWNMTKGPAQNVMATFGKGTWTFSTGASGTYEISKGHVLMNGPSFGGTLEISGDKLIGPGGLIEFQRRADDDTSPVNTGPNFSGSGMPRIDGSPRKHEQRRGEVQNSPAKAY